MDIQAMFDASKNVLSVTKDIAWSFVLLLFVMQIVFVLTKGIGGEKIEHAVSLQALLVVGMLLVFYDQLISWIISMSNNIQDQITPPDFFVHLNQSLTDAIEEYKKNNPESSDSYGSLLGAVLFGNNSIPVWILSITVVFMKVSFLIIRGLSNVAKNFLYVIGPLAIVTRVIPGASILKGWIRGFIEVAFWPILSGIFYQMVAAGAKGVVTAKSTEAYFQLLSMCLIIAVLNLLTPLIVHFLSNNQGIGVAASWAADRAAGMAVAGRSIANARMGKGLNYLSDVWKGKGSKGNERRPGDTA